MRQRIRAVPGLSPAQLARAKIEASIALHVLIEPRKAREIDVELLSPLPRAFVDYVLLAPTLCAEIGVHYYLPNLFCHFDGDYEALADFAEWLDTAPPSLRQSLPELSELMRELRQLPASTERQAVA